MKECDLRGAVALYRIQSDLQAFKQRRLMIYEKECMETAKEK